MKRPEIHRFAGCVLLAALCLGGGLTALAGRHANDSYIITKDSLNAGGGRCQSADYILTGSVGQAAAIGRSGNTLSVNFGGFWRGGDTEPPVFYTLTVEKSGNGSGTVSSNGIDCGADCSEQYQDGTLVLLQAAEEVCSGFVEWQIDSAVVTGPIAVTEDLTVTAIFEACCPAAAVPLAPANGAIEQPLDLQLSWDAAAGATSYTVYFGASSPPPPVAKQLSGTSYDPGPLTVGATYYWKVDAVNTCGTVPGDEWSFTASTNLPPEITSAPPAMLNKTYTYDVDATDPNGDPLTFSLLDAPAGMTIDPVTGQIVWTSAPEQTGSFNPVVQVADNRGGTDSQPIPLTVTAETFTKMTVGFLEGVNLQDGATEQDPTVLSLGVGTNMSGITDILLPNMQNLFTFSALASFHVELQGGAALIVPEPEVDQIAVEDSAAGGKSFAAILPANLSELDWKLPADVPVTDTKSIVFQRSDGKIFKIGECLVNLTEGSVTFTYADVTP